MLRVAFNKIIPIAIVLGLAACTTKPAATASSAPTPSSSRAISPASVTSSIVPGSAQDFQVNVGDTIHFALNKYDIENADKSILNKQAAWLARYPRVTVIVEGHCDERGTREYNIALGARRASTVKEYLMSQGVSSGRMQTVSYGKERPVCTDSNEECWSRNRRGVTVVTSPAVS